MILDTYKNPIFQESDIFEMMYQGTMNFENITVDDTDSVLQFAKNSMVKLSFINNNNDIPISEFDAERQSSWFIPDEYNTFDIYQYCLDNCTSDKQYVRCIEELVLYEKLNMIPVLTLLKYIVDTLRSNNIVWGVGRGSSVASYVLFLLGVHKIDSLKFNLDYTEFLRLGEKNGSKQ